MVEKPEKHGKNREKRGIKSLRKPGEKTYVEKLGKNMGKTWGKPGEKTWKTWEKARKSLGKPGKKNMENMGKS
jgi:hypothetical protein